MKELYKDADIGAAIDIKFKTTSHIAPNIRKVTEGWTLVPDNQIEQVYMKTHNYTCTHYIHSMVMHLVVSLCNKENISLTLGVNGHSSLCR